MPNVDDPLAGPIRTYLNDLASAAEHTGTAIYVRSDERWQRMPDGTARRVQLSTPMLGFLRSSVDQSLASHGALCELLTDDPDFGPLVGGLVGTTAGSSLFSVDTIIYSVLEGHITTEGIRVPDTEVVSGRLAELRTYVTARERASVLIIPLPGLTSPLFPYELDDGIVIGPLDDDEINASAQTGVLQPPFPGMPYLDASDCVGIRINVPQVALALGPNEFDDEFREKQQAQITLESERPHKFGDKSPWRAADLTDDVLFVLRLHRPETITTRGSVLLNPSHMGSSMSWMNRSAPHGFFRTGYVLDTETARAVKETWTALKSNAGKRRSLPLLCVRRFNAAIDRGSLDDSIIDHLICAEALFLKDAGSPEDRGELGYRLALRAAYLLEDDVEKKTSVYRFVKKAYGLRSAVAHGSNLPRTVDLPSRPDIPIHEFISELSDLMRRFLKRAIELYGTDPSFATAEYWDRVILQ